ncbi:MAG TPA: hypothetical protein VMM36_07690 [Opitutaceae bacterium]|nr:hypothetical protein [Opitutaceae bacterium]
MSADGEMEMLVRLCTGLGANEEQARAMAAQLMKRADQLAEERSIPREEAMRYLLEVVTKGRAGGVAAVYNAVRPPISPGVVSNPDGS